MKMHNLIEAGFRDVTGWSKRDIQRMGHEDDAAEPPSRWYKVVDGRMKEKWVYPDDKGEAEYNGWRPDQTRALKHAHIVRSKFHQGKFVKNEGGKWIEVFPFGKPEGVSEEFKGNIRDTEIKNVDPKNHTQGEGNFVKNQLHTMNRVITHLINAIGDDEDLPDWVQSEIAQASDKIVTVMDYSISSKEQDIENSTGNSALMKEQNVKESATVGATSSANVATVINPDYANNANNKPVKSVNALDQNKVSLFGAPMEDYKPKARKKAAIIKRR